VKEVLRRMLAGVRRDRGPRGQAELMPAPPTMSGVAIADSLAGGPDGLAGGPDSLTGVNEAAPEPAGADAAPSSAGSPPLVAVTGDPAAAAARLGVAVGGELPPPEVIVDGEHRYINRELSTLDFNRRVLALAESTDQPLLERAKYLAIFASNMDEFFQVRVAGLKDQQAAGLAGTAPDGLSVSAQLKAIRLEVNDLLARRRRVFGDEIVPELAAHGIRLSSVEALDDEDRAWMEEVFAERILPVLTPLAVDPGHPFPYISNLSLNLAVIVRDPVGGDRRFARLKVPPLLPGFLVMPDGERFVPLEQVIAEHLGSLFPGMEIESHHAFRVTRNADLTLEEEEADDLLAAVEMELRRRRFGRAVRLEVEDAMTEEVRTLLARELDVNGDDVYQMEGPLDLSGLWAVEGLDRPELKDDPFVPVTPPGLLAADDEPLDIFAAIAKGDILLHHPYDSFASTVEEFVAQASRDPAVLAIKQTLYRTSGDSPIVRSLIRAAERGKQVAALVELKARGDEAANIGWARALEQAGVHVVYGLVGLKTHSKTSLVVRQEGDGIRRYCHIGTGNYNSTTARLYEDVGLLSASPELGADLTDLFNFLTGYSRRVEYRELLVAPATLRPRMLELIAAETARGDGGRIVWKLNNLVDGQIIDALYDAAAAGVRIDLITRAICCLRPGVPGLSDNIRVRSIVGRWLEHSRIYYFGNGADVGPGAGQIRDPAATIHRGSGVDDAGDGGGLVPVPRSLPDGGLVLIGSADMMGRNLDRRVEAVVPVIEPDLAARVREILDVELADDRLAWELHGDGTWHKIPAITGFDAHRWFQQQAQERGRRRLDLEPLIPVEGQG
jgi:polyphosphate kinase